MMATLNMLGPYKLNESTVDNIVDKISAGNYALGEKDDKGVFLVSYVGRSDSDVNDRLKYWVKNSAYPLFKYSYAFSAKEAFYKECKNYHDFDPPDNKIHPDKPDGTSYKCPVCKQ